jgi:hypothetical protein
MKVITYWSPQLCGFIPCLSCKGVWLTRKFLRSYTLWFILLLLFIWVSFLEVSKDSEFIVYVLPIDAFKSHAHWRGNLIYSTCVYHLICIATTLGYLSYLHNNNSKNGTLFLWTPFAVQIGIFLAVGLQECASVLSWRKFRGVLLSFLDGLRLLMGAEDDRLPIWPRVLSYTIRYTVDASDNWPCCTRTVRPPSRKLGIILSDWNSRSTR